MFYDSFVFELGFVAYVAFSPLFSVTHTQSIKLMVIARNCVAVCE
jgi:hypothetical protein